MKAILLAGGKGTRLRPLTIHTPKPVVPIFDRPFLHYQLDLLRRVPEIDEVILSLNYQPRRIEEVYGDGEDAGAMRGEIPGPVDHLAVGTDGQQLRMQQLLQRLDVAREHRRLQRPLPDEHLPLLRLVAHGTRVRDVENAPTGPTFP